MAKHGVKEGIDVGLDFISEHRWGSWKRVLDGVPALLNYGAAIKDRLAEIKSAIDARYKQDTEESKTLYELIDKFEREKHPEPKTISIASAIKDAEEANAHFSWDAAFQKVVASMTPQEPSATRKPATPTTQAQSQAQAATPKVASEAPAGVIAPEALARWRERFIKKLDASAKGGNRLKLNVSGKDYVVVSASEANLMVSMQGSQLPMPWAWVTPKSRLSLANGMVTDDDVEALLIAAVFNLEMGQNDQAETLFARATLKDREAVKSAREQLTP